MDARKCPVCGTPSLVTVVSKGQEGTLRQLCSECERRRIWHERSGLREIARGSARLLIYAGVLLALLALTVDRLAISGHAGFGRWQITGTEVGFLCLVLGLLVGRGLLGVAGFFLFVTSLGADVLGLGRAPGLGWRKQAGLAVASLLIAGGMLWYRAASKRDANAPVGEKEGAEG